jgi:uncharacterized protein YndB with AHSA1/START domain
MVRSRSRDPSLQLVMTRVLEAPRDLVFRAWTDPELEKRWSAPLGLTVPVCETDPRPGGAWRLCMRTPVGEELWVGGVYRQVRPPDRLVATTPGRIPTGLPVRKRSSRSPRRVRPADRDGLPPGRFDTVEAREGHGEGWAECFDKLERVLAAGGWSGRLSISLSPFDVSVRQEPMARVSIPRRRLGSPPNPIGRSQRCSS